MSEPRLKTEIWVSAYLRRVGAAGAFAVVARRGDRDAGAVALKVLVAPRLARLFLQSRDLAGAYVWRNPFAAEGSPDGGGEDDLGTREEALIDARLEKEAAVDPDLWIIEVEDRLGRAFID